MSFYISITLVFLSIADKKTGGTIDWTTEIPMPVDNQSYHLTDNFGSIVSENSVWYFDEFARTQQQDTLAKNI